MAGAQTNIEQDDLDEDLRERVGQLLSATLPTTPVTGTAKDLFLLRRHKLFYFNFDPSVTYTNNAFYQPTKRSDWFARGRMVLGANTLIAGRYDVDINLNYSTTKYSKYANLSFDNWGVDTTISTYVGPLIIGGNYQHIVYTQLGLGPNIQGTHLASAFALYVHRFTDRIGATVRGSWGYAFIGGVGPYDYSLVQVSPGFYIRATDTLTVSGDVYWLQKDYKHYFRDFFDGERKDDQIGAGLELSYRPLIHRWLEMSVEVRYTQNYSTIDAFDFDSIDGTGMFKATARF